MRYRHSFALLLLCSSQAMAGLFDLAPFAHPCCVQDRWQGATRFEYQTPPGVQQAGNGRWIYGLEWAEERDISELSLLLRAPFPGSGVSVEYWSGAWPYPPPAMPTMEDPVEDPWQGRWITANARVSCRERQCDVRFFPLAVAENPRAANLPGLLYRRTTKLRLVFATRPQLLSAQVFSGSTVRPMRVRVRGAASEFQAYNGRILKIQKEAGGALLDLAVTEPAPPGSNDVTAVQVRNGDRSYSFAPADLDRGPIYIRAYDAYITLASDTRPFSTSQLDYNAGIRTRLRTEPEQSYERASREIPPLDPVERQGDPLYLPLAADASWQKFALSWGGHVWIGKHATKAFGKELARLTWPGDRIDWRLGTGVTPNFRPAASDSSLSTLENYLPVAEVEWKQGALEYRQESFATLLSGPLSPDDKARGEQTPAILLMRLRIRNTGKATEPAHVWLGLKSADSLRYSAGLLLDGTAVRAALNVAGKIEPCQDGKLALSALHAAPKVAPGQETTLTIAIPFIPGLSAEERKQLKRLDYDAERARVVAYWRSVTDGKVPFEVPEARFNDFAKGLIPRIRISATKDPASGHYMVPAASYYYKVFLNEAAFQSQLLDVLGEHALSAQYLETAVALQGSKPFPGAFTGGQKGVYHGARVNAEYDYTASSYNLDHGTTLWTLGEHYLVTRDRAWLHQALPSMKRASDWIIEQRRLTQQMDGEEKCAEYGLLPAGHLEDNQDWGHWFSVNAYASAGLTRLAQILEEIADPDAARYTSEAAAYREDLRAAVLRAASESPVIRMRDGSYSPYVPTRAHQRLRLFGRLRAAFYQRYGARALPTFRLSATREVLYGPMILLDTGLFGVTEPLADWVLDDWEDNATMSSTLGINPHGLVDEKLWFSQGGMVFQANLQNPIRSYLRREEIPAAIRNLYNDFVACYYPGANVFTEEFRQWRIPSGPFYKVPDEAKFVHRLRETLVMEYDDRLWLAAGTPRRWLEPGKRIVVRDAPSLYGPVSFELDAGANAITGSIRLPRRNPFADAQISVRVPEGRQIARVLLDGKPWAGFDARTGRIRLPMSRAEIKLTVELK